MDLVNSIINKFTTQKTCQYFLMEVVDMSFKVSWKTHVLCLVMTFLICFIMHDCLVNISTGLIINNAIINITGNLLLDEIILFLLIFIPLNIVHELLHGSIYRLFGGKVKYGFKGICAYTQEISGIILHRNKFLLVLLAPVTVISIISTLIPGEIGGIVYFVNIAGSTGDILMALYLCKCNENSYIIDREYGFDVILKPLSAISIK